MFLRGLGAYASPLAEICATGHCDYYTWTEAACRAAYASRDQAGCPAAAPAPAPSAPAVPVEAPGLIPIAPAPVIVQTSSGPGTIIEPAAASTPAARSLQCPAAYPIASLDQWGQLECQAADWGKVTPFLNTPYLETGGQQIQVVPATGGGNVVQVSPAVGQAASEQYITDTVPAPPVDLDWIPGVPNWAVVVGGAGLAAVALARIGGRK